MIRVFFFAFLLTITSTFLVKSQALITIPSDTISKSGTITSNIEIFEVKGWISNNYGMDTAVSWELMYIDLPSTWYSGYCDDLLCVDLSILTSGEYSLADGDSAQSKIQFTSDWQPGYGEIHIALWVSRDRAATEIVMVFKADISVDSTNWTAIVEQPQTQEGISVYPSPAKDYVSISLHDESLKNVEVKIFNVLGAEVGSYKLNNQTGNRTIVDLKDFQQGVYFAKINDPVSKKTYTRRFHKVK